MARKRVEATEMPATEAQAELKAVRLYLPAGHHKRLRRIAADYETNMALMARKIVMEYIDRQDKEGRK